MSAHLDDRLAYRKSDLLASELNLSPLIAGGVRCHGGFDADGKYRSPRTSVRMPAIRAWQAQLDKSGHGVLAIPEGLLPPHYPSVPQAKLLLLEGVREPIIRALTMIAIVEGFGAIIRDVPIPDLRALIREPIEGTALAHLGEGLFEAHARDEAGYESEGGHKQMWEAARDLALDKPKIPSDILMRIMSGGGARAPRERMFPAIDETLEGMLTTMVSVLVIEVFAADTFDWGERLLSDPDVSANPTEAGKMVSYIRSDELPHVEYLRTALSELRARTLRGTDGSYISGKTVVDAMLHRSLKMVTKSRPEQQRNMVHTSMIESMKNEKNEAQRASVIERFDALEMPWTAPELTGFEPA